jgi:hypothetical protein
VEAEVSTSALPLVPVVGYFGYTALIGRRAKLAIVRPNVLVAVSFRLSGILTRSISVQATLSARTGPCGRRCAATRGYRMVFRGRLKIMRQR